jgi:hypothetical protein
MDPQIRSKKSETLQQLRAQAQQLERELRAPPEHWQATSYYGMYHATAGFFLGGIAALVSLSLNIIGASVFEKHPLRLVQVYLTFPLGEKALSDEFSTGMALAVGCCLYIATGMLLGIVFQMAIARVMPNAGLGPRIGFASILGLALWGFNFYCVLSWLQPLLFGGNWIVDPQLLPPWVAILTHLAFAWAMAILYPFGAYKPYRPQTEIA